MIYRMHCQAESFARLLYSPGMTRCQVIRLKRCWCCRLLVVLDLRRWILCLCVLEWFEISWEMLETRWTTDVLHDHPWRQHSVQQHSSCFFTVSVLTSTPSIFMLEMTRRASLGDRAFPVVAARAWNGLPDYVTSASTYASFRTALKTYLILTTRITLTL